MTSNENELMFVSICLNMEYLVTYEVYAWCLGTILGECISGSLQGIGALFGAGVMVHIPGLPLLGGSI